MRLAKGAVELEPLELLVLDVDDALLGVHLFALAFGDGDDLGGRVVVAHAADGEFALGGASGNAASDGRQ